MDLFPKQAGGLYPTPRKISEGGARNDENLNIHSSFKLPPLILVESVGFEPTMAGLQNQCLPNLATIPNKNQNIALPLCFVVYKKIGRSGETRTHDPLRVKQPLLPLSYASKAGVGFRVSGVRFFPDTRHLSPHT